VAIARALILQPNLVLCDEPTGNLDRVSAAAVADLLLRLHRESNSVLVVVTHSTDLAGRFQLCFELRERGLHEVAR
jgi:ABC-type lipoprotein export system ATPase subunit